VWYCKSQTLAYYLAPTIKSTAESVEVAKRVERGYSPLKTSRATALLYAGKWTKADEVKTGLALLTGALRLSNVATTLPHYAHLPDAAWAI